MHEQKLLGQIMGLAFRLNQNSKFNVFVEFSGHVNELSVEIRDPMSRRRLVQCSIYVTRPDAEAKLVEVGSQLSDILTTGEIDYSRLYKGRYGHREAYFFCYDSLSCNPRYIAREQLG
ncbi:hypothetical protein [Paenibacillus sp. UNC451MF]|uniref:hypothetical protein n=1 Tax=Paenibacillus sp. UNC451MF TaxID=1449063 RepID=UPI00048C534E|nr:hypothetical protein [Paenibacillus sp. UNC451MF]